MEPTANDADCIYLDGLRLDLARGVLERHGQAVAVRPKVYALLSYMARHPDRVIGKEELLRQVWGKVALSDDVLTQSVKELRRVIGDSGGRILQTFSRRGYLLKPSQPPRPHIQRDASKPEQAGQSEPASDCQPSVAVLAFDNLSDPADNDSFAMGLVEDIVVGLSRFRWLQVIARNSSFKYRGSPIDVQLIGRDLDVRYIVQGTVRRTPRQLRVTAQLVDTAKGSTLWADRFESAVEDLFDLQDRVTERLVAAIEPAFAGHADTAIRLADRAYRLSPHDPLVYQAQLAKGVAAIAQDRPEEAATHLNLAVEANPALSSLYFTAASAHALSGHVERARELAGQGLELEPTFRLRLFAELMAHPVAQRLAEGGRLAGLPH